jgi:hypothetical protein
MRTALLSALLVAAVVAGCSSSKESEPEAPPCPTAKDPKDQPALDKIYALGGVCGGSTDASGFTAKQVLLCNKRFTDDVLADLKEDLKELEEVRELRLDLSAITDKGVEHVKDLTQLTKLDLSSTQVTDNVVESLKALTNLEELTIDDTQVTKEGVTEIRRRLGLSKLRSDY